MPSTADDRDIAAESCAAFPAAGCPTPRWCEADGRVCARRDPVAATKRRLSARTARYCLAREMWMRANDLDHADAWDDDMLPTSMYERFIEMADVTIRKEMVRGRW